MKKRSILFLLCTITLLFSQCSKDDESGDLNFADSSLDNADVVSGNISPSEGEEIGGGEEYGAYIENAFIKTIDEPVSTFSIDADGGSYSNIRRFLKTSSLPPQNAVRIEEMINYFDYDYPSTKDGHPLSVNTEVGTCPWNSDHKLIQIGIKGERIDVSQLPASNLTFLVDVSGSMSSDDKLGLFKEGIKLLVNQMDEEDRIAIVTYASNPGVHLEATAGDKKNKIINAINELGAGGSTAGEGGILAAYEIAQANFIEGGNNRIIMATDGDFNVGLSGLDELIELIEKKREEKNIFLTTLGFGTGNYRETILEQLANNGNGTYEYIDDIKQAEKVFIHDFGKLYTVAKDVKIQVDFNPSVVAQYRLVGYENRLLENEDFEDDKKDAGELGSGQNVTAIYEVILASRATYLNTIPLSVDFRYKTPTGGTSTLIEVDAIDLDQDWASASENFRFAASVAAFGLLLRDSEYKGDATFDKVKQWGQNASSFDPGAYRAEYLQLVDRASKL